jgi:hypothetical protein
VFSYLAGTTPYQKSYPSPFVPSIKEKVCAQRFACLCVGLVCVCVCVGGCMCVRARVRVCVCARARVCVCVCVTNIEKLMYNLEGCAVCVGVWLRVRLITVQCKRR